MATNVASRITRPNIRFPPIRELQLPVDKSGFAAYGSVYENFFLPDHCSVYVDPGPERWLYPRHRRQGHRWQGYHLESLQRPSSAGGERGFEMRLDPAIQSPRGCL